MLTYQGLCGREFETSMCADMCASKEHVVRYVRVVWANSHEGIDINMLKLANELLLPHQFPL